MNCRVCNHKLTTRVYSGSIRDGGYGKISDRDYSVLFCSNCEVKFLNPFPIGLKAFYESEKYRKDYNNNKEIEAFRRTYDGDQLYKIQKIGLENIRDKVVADFGAGGGSFLDSVSGFSAKTIAIEPARMFHEGLGINHLVFPYGKDLVKSGIKADIAVSFDVLEHIEKPIEYLSEISKCLANKGKIFLLTPNSNDILETIVPEDFEPFNYRTAHLFYFNEKSLDFLFRKAGFTKINFSYIHKYDISNLLMWLKEKKPTGKNKCTYFNESFNESFCKYLENEKMSSHIWVEAEK